MADDYFFFLDLADQFLISYSVEIPFFIPVKYFEIGHAVELYLKAAYTKIDGDAQKAINFNHNLYKLWEKCKAANSFMPSYEIRDRIINTNFVKKRGLGLDQEDLHHFFENEELYTILKHTMNLKYIGVYKDNQKEINNGSIWVMKSQNTYWISFFKELRTFLNWPNPSHFDWIKDSIEDDFLPKDAKLYLRKLYDE